MPERPTTPSNERSDREQRPQHSIRASQLWKLVFALVLIWVLAMEQAKGCDGTGDVDCRCEVMVHTMNLAHDGFTPAPWPPHGHPDESTAGWIDSRTPASAQLLASLANFDRDADPDGWRAQVVLLDSQGVPAPRPARAVFELTDRPEFGSKPLARWSRKLDFDPQGVAAVSLPLRPALRSKFGWKQPPTPLDETEQRWNGSTARQWSRRYRNQPYRTIPIEYRIATPEWGWLRVRVVTAEGSTYRAFTSVPLRPPFLVDINPTYR